MTQSQIPGVSLNRRRVLALGTVGAAMTVSARFAAAAVHLNITQGNFQPMPIAIPQFFGSAADTSRAITQITAADLQRCGLFVPIDPNAYTETISNINAVPTFADWRAIKAQALVVGRVDQQTDGRLRAEFRLWDVLSGQQIGMGQQYVTTPDNWRRLGHIIADAVYQRITGLKGYFDSRVVYVDGTGTKRNRIKRLALMDQDGANLTYLTRGDELVLTPRFSPAGQEVAYMAYGQGDPRVYLLNITTQEREIVGNFPGMSFSPRFSPNGQSVIMSLQEGANTNLFVMDLRSKATTRLTNTDAIDTSPCYSPDASNICFTSDRGGQPQIYIMPGAGGPARRISFGDGKYSTPVWSPTGEYIAFTKQTASNFSIGVMKPDGSGERILTEGFDVEGPTFAPNGQVIMFFSDAMGAAGPALYTVGISGRNQQRVPTPSFGSDPSWSSLLS
jgi:TolB protein